VELKYAHDLALRVRDDGVGIDLAMTDKGKAGHFGLRGMRERAARIGGKFTILSSTNSGTEIIVVVPGRIVFRRASETTMESVKAIFYRRPAPVDNSRESSVDDVYRKAEDTYPDRTCGTEKVSAAGGGLTLPPGIV